MPPVRWLCITTPTNGEITRQKYILGVGKRYAHTIARVKKGDTLCMYTMQEIVEHKVIPSAIIGIYVAVSDGYEDESPLFVTPKALGNEVFPLRIKGKPVKVFSGPVPFKLLVPEMSFIKNKVRWSGSLVTPMRVILETDYRIIYTSGAMLHDRSGLRK